ncbi:MAG: TolC family protein [Tannerella sp.]|jgi:outer membrane protein|nr:TolC family protein [Tannerella sp.]
MERIKSILFFMVITIAVNAQNDVNLWTLHDCIDYALEHNIQVKKSKVNQLSGNEDLLQSKAQLFPSLSAGTSQNFTNYPSSDATTNNSYSGSYNISANWNLFDGGRRSYNIKQNQIQQDVNELSVQQSENDIRLSIIQAYMQVLYAMESVRTNENTVDVSKAQRDRGEELLKAGSISRVDLAQLESQYSSDKYRLVTSQTNLDNYLLQLKQLLEFDITEEIKIEMPDLSESDIMLLLPDKETIYSTALSVMPEIKSSELSISVAELDIKKARAGYLPSLSMNAAIGTGHVSGTDINFGDQVWNRFNENIGLTLSVPIYSNRENKTAVNKARLASITSELELINAQKQLLKTVEGVYLDATSAQNQYLAAVEQVKYAEESYSLIDEQFSLGMKNTLELLTAKNDFLNAQQELLQAKYMAVMSIQLLNIYQNKPIDEI